MCVQCKSLTGCSRHGCSQNTAPRRSVAELLAESFPSSDKQRSETATQVRHSVSPGGMASQAVAAS